MPATHSCPASLPVHARLCRGPFPSVPGFLDSRRIAEVRWGNADQARPIPAAATNYRVICQCVNPMPAHGITPSRDGVVTGACATLCVGPKGYNSTRYRCGNPWSVCSRGCCKGSLTGKQHGHTCQTWSQVLRVALSERHSGAHRGQVEYPRQLVRNHARASRFA